MAADRRLYDDAIMAPKKEEQPGVSDSDRMELDALLEERKHRRWLAQLVKRWALWIFAVIVGIDAGAP